MPPPFRPPQLVRAELIRLDSHLQGADARGDFESFERWAREVLAHPCAPHTWTVALVTDMLVDCLIERDAMEEAAGLVDANTVSGRVAEPFATLRAAELALLAGDREGAEARWATLAGEGGVDAFTALSVGLLLEDVAGDREAALGWYTRGVEDLLAGAEAGARVDLAELDHLLEVREQCRVALDLPARDALSERAMDVPLDLEEAPPREEYPPDPSTLVPCDVCGYRPGQDDAPITGYRVAVAWDPAEGPSPAVDRELRDLRVDAGQTPVLVRAPAEAVAGWAGPYGYEGEEARELFAAMSPDEVRVPWPPARNDRAGAGRDRSTSAVARREDAGTA